MCLPYLKFSDMLPETHFFYSALAQASENSNWKLWSCGFWVNIESSIYWKYISSLMALDLVLGQNKALFPISWVPTDPSTLASSFFLPFLSIWVPLPSFCIVLLASQGQIWHFLTFPSFLKIARRKTRQGYGEWLTHFVPTQVKINTHFERKIVNIFLTIGFNICFGCSKERSHWDNYFAYQQHMFW